MTAKNANLILTTSPLSENGSSKKSSTTPKTSNTDSPSNLSLTNEEKKRNDNDGSTSSLYSLTTAFDNSDENNKKINANAYESIAVERFQAVQSNLVTAAAATMILLYGATVLSTFQA